MYVSDTFRLRERESSESGYVFFCDFSPKGEVPQDEELRKLWKQNKSFAIVLPTRRYL